MIPRFLNRSAASVMLIVTALNLMSLPAIAQSDDPKFQLGINEQLALPAAAGSLQRVAIGDPSVADVMVSRGDVLLIGRKAGNTQLLVWPRNAKTPQRYAVQVRGALDASVLGEHAATVSAHADSVLISGSSDSLLDHADARSAALASGGDKLVDRSTIATGGMVQVDVKVVEFSKTALKQAGFNLSAARSGGFGFGLFGPGQLNSVTKDNTSISFDATQPISSAFNLVLGRKNGVLGTLSILQGNGLARLLAEPSLVAQSGQSANFLSGGELPIPVPQGLGTTTITYKPFGIGLTVTPTVLAGDRIALKVAPEASELDYGNGVTIDGVQVPALSTRRTDTSIELGDGESFVISGLVSRSTLSSVNRVPLLGHLPIIGAFFRDVNYSRHEKELVFIVTPHLVRPFARGAVLPLPGEREEGSSGNAVWGSYLLGVGNAHQIPGFSQ